MNPLFAFGMPGMQELLLILVIVLVLFGAKRLPELARGLGQSMNEFRKAKDEFEREVQRSADDIKDEKPVAKTAKTSKSAKSAQPADTTKTAPALETASSPRASDEPVA